MIRICWTSWACLFLTMSCWGNAVFAQTEYDADELDVLSYVVELEPSIAEKSLSGVVHIQFRDKSASEMVAFACGSLLIDSVSGVGVESFRQENRSLLIHFSSATDSIRNVTISYHGTPRRGVEFFPEQQQVYTVFFTSEWMVCNKRPKDRASLRIELIIPDHLTGISNGELVKKEAVPPGKSQYVWVQQEEMPAYTFGFAVGLFHQHEFEREGVQLVTYSEKHSPEELAIIFAETANMLAFFEEKAGILYSQQAYTQILGKGYASQEMAGFTVLREGYGAQVLADETQINLGAHELAHQWWGNRITCSNWNHFWLNEGMAVFMSSAFKEHRFGEKVYLEDIAVYENAYRQAVAKQGEKALVFPNWFNPSAEDRAIVYYKGAYVLHLLREELGEELFWKGIKHYTRSHDLQAVVSQDFQLAMETAAERSLADFFAKWVY